MQNDSAVLVPFLRMLIPARAEIEAQCIQHVRIQCFFQLVVDGYKTAPSMRVCLNHGH